jgi:hypothetical protein
MSFQDECDKADGRYRAGKDPVHTEAEHWARARDVQGKLRRGSIPSTWDRPEWTLDRLYWHSMHVAEQARLRLLGVRNASTGRDRAAPREVAGEA